MAKPRNAHSCSARQNELKKLSTCGRQTCSHDAAGSTKPPGLETLVSKFRTEFGSAIKQEDQFFRTMPSIDLAIHHVALAIDGNEKCFDHQFRITQSARRRAKEILDASVARLRSCRSFHELHSLLVELLSPVWGLGELYIYDAAVRLGAFLRLTPQYIYLHAGTRLGAKALGLNSRRDYLEKRDLPSSLQALTADEIESFLCIYKDEL